ncbi:YdcF family protein [Brucella sp. 6810]|uniref:YdcF family protein n=1 Tax=Brucella sp. 6810 TaxID=2769351 RepID=UPI00165B6536|nr:YdcF family protein [Brucella sp. 6810]QNQ64205.1 YdcF family protein [Brucella sp. 6810]
MTLYAFPCAILLGLAAMFFSQPLLTLQDDGRSADVIIVPGGDGAPRAAQAAQLWKDGRSPYILATGDGDCLLNKHIMMAKGVPPSAILVECRSGSTWQNARFSAPLLRRLHAKSALIVTNWFHSRRAVASFRTACPQMHFTSSPVADADMPGGFPGTPPVIEHVVKEYAKLGWYLISGRIRPQNLTDSGPAMAFASVCNTTEAGL